jgi:hypothetical protein
MRPDARVLRGQFRRHDAVEASLAGHDEHRQLHDASPSTAASAARLARRAIRAGAGKCASAAPPAESTAKATPPAVVRGGNLRIEPQRSQQEERQQQVRASHEELHARVGPPRRRDRRHQRESRDAFRKALRERDRHQATVGSTAHHGALKTARIERLCHLLDVGLEAV